MKLAKGLYKTAKAGVIGSTDIEIMVKEATNSDPFGPAGTTLSELSDLVSKNPEYRQEALQTLLTRLELPAENWRKIYKALLVIEYLAKNSVKRVVEDLKDPLMFEEIERKVKFKFVDLETGRDEGTQVRAKAAALVNLLNDAERLGKEREAAKTARSRIYGSDSRASADSRSDSPPPPSSTTRGRKSQSFDDELDEQYEKSEKRYDIRIKREALSHSSLSSFAPSTPQDEDEQLKAAIALSLKESAAKASKPAAAAPPPPPPAAAPAPPPPAPSHARAGAPAAAPAVDLLDLSSPAPPSASTFAAGKVGPAGIDDLFGGMSNMSLSPAAPPLQGLNNNLNNNWNPFQASPPAFQGGQGNMAFQGFQAASDPFAATPPSAGMAASDPFSVMALSSGSGHGQHGLAGAPPAVDMSSSWVQFNAPQSGGNNLLLQTASLASPRNTNARSCSTAHGGDLLGGDWGGAPTASAHPPPPAPRPDPKAKALASLVNLDNIAVSAKEKAEQELHKAAEERAKALMAAVPRTPMNQLGPSSTVSPNFTMGGGAMGNMGMGMGMNTMGMGNMGNMGGMNTMGMGNMGNMGMNTMGMGNMGNMGNMGMNTMMMDQRMQTRGGMGGGMMGGGMMGGGMMGGGMQGMGGGMQGMNTGGGGMHNMNMGNMGGGGGAAPLYASTQTQAQTQETDADTSNLRSSFSY